MSSCALLLSKARISQASRCSSICEERAEACPSVLLEPSSFTRSKSLPELGHSFIHSIINSMCSFCSGWVLLEMHFPSIAPHISVYSQISSLPTLLIFPAHLPLSSSSDAPGTVQPQDLCTGLSFCQEHLHPDTCLFSCLESGYASFCPQPSWGQQILRPWVPYCLLLPGMLWNASSDIN